MNKKLEDMTAEEISIQAQKNLEEFQHFEEGLKLASKSIGITLEQGIQFIDVMNKYLAK